MSKVAYYFDDEIGTFFYGQYHPMKPLRMKITHEMLKAYDILPKFKRILPEEHPEFVENSLKSTNERTLKRVHTMIDEDLYGLGLKD